MSRLIDADALLKYHQDHEIISTHLIWNAPTIDAVEVVRCRECRFKCFNDDEEIRYYYCALEDRPNRNWSVTDEDYCSWGERNEDE